MQRGKKRKFHETERSGSTDPLRKIDISNIILKETNWIPEMAVKFYNQFENMESRLKEIDSTASLVGPFRKLKGETEVEGIELVMLDRDITDLPEMQTFLKCAAGRYAFWRDTPWDTKPMIVFVDRKTIPVVNMVGYKVEHAILDFCEKSTMFGINLMSSKYAKSVVFNYEHLTEPFDIVLEEKTAKDAVRKRKSNCVGGKLGYGLVPNCWNKGKNRELTHDSAVIESLLRSLRLVGIKEEEDRVGQIISFMYGETMECVNEGLHGNALELGYLLFLANHKTVLDPLCIILYTAYSKLGHYDFIKILGLTLELREYSL